MQGKELFATAREYSFNDAVDAIAGIRRWGYFLSCGNPDCTDHRAAAERLVLFLRANPTLMPPPKRYGWPCLRKMVNDRYRECQGVEKCEASDGLSVLLDHRDVFRATGPDGVNRLVIISHPYVEKAEERIWQPADKPEVRVRFGYRPEQLSWRNHGDGVGYAVAVGEELNFDYIPPSTEKTSWLHTPSCGVDW